MDSNEEKINSTLIKVEALQKEYEVLLQQYQEAMASYVTDLQNISSNPCSNFNGNSTNISQDCYSKIWADQGCLTQAPDSDWAKSQTLNNLVNDSFLWATLTDDSHRKGCYGDSTNYTTNTNPIFPNVNIFTALKGRTWWGTNKLSQVESSSVEECQSMCLNSDKCSGATFNPVKRYCWLRQGNNGLSAGQEDDYALIPKQTASLEVLQSLNKKLLELNQEISYELSNINPEVETQNIENNKKQQQLNKSYKQLLNEKMKMQKKLEEYYSIVQNENNEYIFTTQQNVSLRFWVLITCLVLLITIKRMLGSSSPPISIIFWLLMIIILIILTYSLSSPAGFLMWFMLIVIIFLMKTGNLPSV
jgi:hypothetical protein